MPQIHRAMDARGLDAVAVIPLVLCFVAIAAAFFSLLTGS